MSKRFMFIIIVTLLVSTSIAGSGIGIGITKTLDGNENFYQGNLFNTWGIFGVNLRVIDYKGKSSGESYLFTPYLQLLLSTRKDFTTIYGGIAPVIYYKDQNVGFDNLYYVNAGLKLTLAIFSVYVEANFLGSIDFNNNIIQFSSTPMVTIGGMLYIR